MTMLRKFWNMLWRPHPQYALGLLVGVGIVIGIVFWGGFNWALELSNREAFCISCHEMRSTVYQELKKSVHYKNTSGVTATCADCHVPREWIYKVGRKISATFHELPLHLIGAVDTKEAFEAKRLELAKHVWATMKATDSRECRNCHHFRSMELDKQAPRARAQHASAQKEGETCIDCHKGIAHKPVHKELEKAKEKEQGKESFTIQ